MRIALLTSANAAEYRLLMLQAYEQAADAFTSTAEERAAEPASYWERRIADPEGLGLAFGAFDGERLTGTVALEFSNKPKTRHKALLIGMFVEPACRGMGAGRRLMEAAIDHASARPGLLTITLTVTHDNAPAVHLYESCGFQQFGVEPMAILTPSGYQAKRHMWLNLAPDSAGTR